jgi:hypothetical protein
VGYAEESVANSCVLPALSLHLMLEARTQSSRRGLVRQNRNPASRLQPGRTSDNTRSAHSTLRGGLRFANSLGMSLPRQGPRRMFVSDERKVTIDSSLFQHRTTKRKGLRPARCRATLLGLSARSAHSRGDWRAPWTAERCAADFAVPFFFGKVGFQSELGRNQCLERGC